MKLQYFLVGMLIASSFIVGTTTFIGELTTNTGLQVNSSYNSTFDKTSDLLGREKQLNDNFRQNPISTLSINPLQISSWPIIGTVYDSFSIVFDMISSTGKELNLPAWITTLILGLLTLGLIFAIMSAIFFGRQV